MDLSATAEQYDAKQSDGEAKVILKPWGSVPIYGSNRTKLHAYAKLNCFK